MTPRKKTDVPDDGEQVETVSTDKTSRRRTRELALSCCFEILVGGQEVDKVLKRTIETQKVDRAAGEYLQAAVLATERHKGQLDEIISELAVGWKLDRIARVDLCILRLSISELLMDLETPPPPEAVVINEAVVLAKKFSTEDSGRFVNGILGTVAKDKEKYRERLNPASG